MLSQTIFLLTVTACAAVPSSIVRPCASVRCIARSLASLSTCNPHVRGSVPAAYKIRRFRSDVPFFNSTNIDHNLIIRNHDKCEISEYYINLETRRLVLGLDCPGLELQSTRTVIQHYSLREDAVFQYFYHGIYPKIRLTSSMQLGQPLGEPLAQPLGEPLAQPLDLCRAFTFADVTALPTYRINPNNNKTASYLSKDDTFLNIYERETFYYRASQLMRYYVNSVLCDFGCNF